MEINFIYVIIIYYCKILMSWKLYIPEKNIQQLMLKNHKHCQN